MPHPSAGLVTDALRRDVDMLVERRGALERDISERKIILTAAEAGQIITTAETQAAAIIGEARADARRILQKAEEDYQAKRATEQARLEDELNGIKAGRSVELVNLTSRIVELQQLTDELSQGREKLSQKVLDGVQELNRITAASQRMQEEAQAALALVEQKQARVRSHVVDLVNMLEPYCT